MEAQGKFEGDEFEPLFVKVDTEAALLRVLIAQGLPVEFDLSSRAFVFEDSADPTAIILDYRSNIVVFKVSTCVYTVFHLVIDMLVYSVLF